MYTIRRGAVILAILALCLFPTACETSDQGLFPGRTPSAETTFDDSQELSTDPPASSDAPATQFDGITQLTWLVDEIALWGVTPARLDAFNVKLMEKGANFVLSIVPIPGATSESNYTEEIRSYIESGKQADLIFTGVGFSGGLPNGVNDSYLSAWQNDFLLPLGAYLRSEHGLPLYEQFSEHFWDACAINGEIYGIDILSALGSFPTIRIDSAFLARHQLSPPGNVNELEALAPILASIPLTNEKYPIELPAMSKNIMGFLGYDYVNMSVAMDPRHPERGAFNLFEDEAFLAYLKTARRFVETGYINPDKQAEYGESSISVLGADPISLIERQEQDAVYWQFGELQVETARIVTGVSRTTQHFDEAATLLTMLYTDRELADILAHGVEGTDYQRIDGVVHTSTGSPGAIFLRTFSGLTFFSSPMSDEKSDLRDTAYADYMSVAALSPLAGFHFDDRGWEETVSAVNNAVWDYTTAEESDTTNLDNALPVRVYRGPLTGHDEHYEDTLASLRQELKRVGIDDLIEEINRQYDHGKA